MQNSERLCLKWNDFQENLNTLFGVLRNDKEFSDVTLACEDGTHVEAHKVVLISSSPFFMEILKKNKHPHPLVYMRKVKSENLLAILDFLYNGKANLEQENLDAFLELAGELKLRGLAGASADIDNKYDPDGESPKNNDVFTKPKIEPLLKTANIADPKPSVVENKTVVLANTEDVQQLDEEIKSMMEVTGNTITTGNRTRKVWLCKVCGKESTETNMKMHIEAHHLSNAMAFSCDTCGKRSRSRHGLRMHKAREHSSSF